MFRKYGFPSSKFFTNADSDHENRSQGYLGYVWTLPADTIQPNIPTFDEEPAITLTVRQVVRTVSQYYDPLGLDLRTQLAGRLIIRRAFSGLDSKNVWKRDVQDSETITTELNKWKEMVHSGEIKALRKYDSEHVHIFADASQMCWAYEIRDTNMELIYARGGLTAPSASIPRSELIAIQEAICDYARLHQLLGARRVTFYSDSECTIHRIGQLHSSKMPKHEQTRVHKILEALAALPSGTRIVHLPGDLNPADYPTRPTNTRTVRPVIDQLAISKYTSDDQVTSFPRSEKSDDAPINTRDEVRLMVLRKRRKTETDRTTQNIGSDAATEDMRPAQADTDDQDDRIEQERRIDSIKRSQERHNLTPNEHMTIDQWGIIRVNDRIVIPHADDELKDTIMRRIHERNHWGIEATIRNVSEHYTWRNMRTDIKRHVRNCEICQRGRTYRTVRTTAGDALKLEDIESVPIGSIVGIDVVVIEGIQEGQPSCAITATCLLSKWIRAEPMEAQTSEQIIEALNDMFHRTSFPRVLVMDNAPAFRSRNMKRFAVKHGIRLCYLPPHASAYGGWIERSHQSILSGLRTLVLSDPSKPWSGHLAEACYLANSRPYDKNSNLSPLALVYGAAEKNDPEALDSTEDLIRSAQILHLSSPSTNSLGMYAERILAKQRRKLKIYEYLFNKTRREVQTRLRETVKKERTCMFQPGTQVRVFRPVVSKVKARWSEPRVVIGVPSGGTRIVRKADGSSTLEWVANLMKVHEDESGPLSSANPE